MVPRVDVVITATGATEPIVTRQMVRKALRRRRYAPLFLVDLSVPRNIEPAIDDLDGAYLFNVDDLKQVVEEGLAAREKARQSAEDVVKGEAMRFVQSLARVEIGPRIGVITQKAEQLRQVELARSQKLIESLDPEQQEQLDALTKALVKKILHDPLRGIHEAAQEGDALRLEYLLGAWKEDER